MELKKTGNEIVDRMAEINITGDVMPATWYRTIKTDSGRPHYLAAAILAHIVYWYRPAVIRDEQSGEIVGVKKKFRGDVLQLHYKDLCKKYEETQKTVVRAVIVLERLGVVKRELRKIKAAGVTLSNVLYIHLDPEALFRLTYPEEDGSEVSMGGQKERNTIPTELSTPIDRCVDGCGLDGIEDIDRIVQTYTKNTTENTTENTDHIYPSDSGQYYNAQAYKQIIKDKIEYDILADRMEGYDRERLEGLYNLICDVVCTDGEGSLRINGIDRSYREVRERFLELDMSHIQYILHCLGECTSEIHNIRAYMLAALYNAPVTIGHYYQAVYNYNEGDG